jgi:hypothetical protein
MLPAIAEMTTKEESNDKGKDTTILNVSRRSLTSRTGLVALLLADFLPEIMGIVLWSQIRRDIWIFQSIS